MLRGIEYFIQRHSRSLEIHVAPFDSLHTTFYRRLWPYLYHFRDKAGYWSKSAIFFIPPAFDAPLRDIGLRRNIALTFGSRKIRMV